MRSVPMKLLVPLALALAPAPAAGQPSVVDTLVSFRPGRVEIHNHKGDVKVATWDRDAVRVVARRSAAVPLLIERKGTTLVVRSPTQPVRNAKIDYEITSPRSADLEIHSLHGRVTVTGAGGRVEAHAVNGDVTITGGRDRVEVHSVQGLVEVTGARGDVEVHSVNRGVVLREIAGSVKANVVNGRIELDRVDARRLEVTTVNGPIAYTGPIHADGVYKLNTHNGRIVMVFPRGASARVQVSTFNGTVRSLFPVQLDESDRGKRFGFTLGAGEAQVELTSFNGTIELRRP